MLVTTAARDRITFAVPVMEMENVIAFQVRVQTLKEDIPQNISLKKDRLLTPLVLMLFLGADGDPRPVPRALPSH